MPKKDASYYYELGHKAARRGGTRASPHVSGTWRDTAWLDGFDAGLSEKFDESVAERRKVRRPKPSPTAYHAAMEKAKEELTTEDSARWKVYVELSAEETWKAVQEYLARNQPSLKLLGVQVTSFNGDTLNLSPKEL